MLDPGKRGWKALKLVEAGLAMLLTVGLIGAAILILLCVVLSVPWPVGIAALAIVWVLLTLDFYSAELESGLDRASRGEDASFRTTPD